MNLFTACSNSITVRVFFITSVHCAMLVVELDRGDEQCYAAILSCYALQLQSLLIHLALHEISRFL